MTASQLLSHMLKTPECRKVLTVVKIPVHSRDVHCFSAAGKLIRRQRLPKNDFGDNWHWKDLNNGVNVTFYGRIFHLYDCDKWTKVQLRDLNFGTLTLITRHFSTCYRASWRARVSLWMRPDQHRAILTSTSDRKRRSFVDTKRRPTSTLCDSSSRWTERFGDFCRYPLRNFMFHSWIVMFCVSGSSFLLCVGWSRPNVRRNPKVYYSRKHILNFEMLL